MAATIAVLVPGITGTTLLDLAGAVVWPDEVAAAPDAARTLLSGDLHPGRPIEKLKNPRTHEVIHVYSGLIAFFEEKGYTYHVYHAAKPHDLPNKEKVLVGFGYDWRKSNMETAEKLNALLTRIAAKYPGGQVWLVGHSMGGLVSRYLIESGMMSNPASKVKGLITLGTPHLGAPLALSAITGEEDLSKLLNPDIVERVIDMPRYPGGFELLPPEPVSFVLDQAGKPYSVYSGQVNMLLVARHPAGFDAPATSFKDAQKFAGKLNYGDDQGNRPPYGVVYGSGFADTVGSFAYKSTALTPKEKLKQNKSSVGDEIVPVWSASFGKVQPEGTRYSAGYATALYDAGAVSHGQLPNDAEVLKTVMRWIETGIKPKAPATAEVPATEPALAG